MGRPQDDSSLCRLRSRRVDVLKRDRDQVWIRSGIEEGESVCVTPLAVVVDGMRVEVASGSNDARRDEARDSSS